MTNLFTYGSLMCNDIMCRVAGCRASFVSAILKDFRRSTLHGVDYPGIATHPGAEVQGVLYLDLPPEALLRLDIFEGEQYKRQEVQVLTAQGDPSKAMTYIIKPAYNHLLTGEPWSYQNFLDVGKAKFLKAYLGFQRI
jgi:gamma-glutamylcyclotransferase (GGCT)/AIG2-like uncharacterized protein YtfP